jgi:hypothetical protein
MLPKHGRSRSSGVNQAESTARLELGTTRLCWTQPAMRGARLISMRACAPGQRTARRTLHAILSEDATSNTAACSQGHQHACAPSQRGLVSGEPGALCAPCDGHGAVCGLHSDTSTSVLIEDASMGTAACSQAHQHACEPVQGQSCCCPVYTRGHCTSGNWADAGSAADEDGRAYSMDFLHTQSGAALPALGVHQGLRGQGCEQRGVHGLNRV